MNCQKLNNPSMDKRKRLKHTVNKAKEESTMEKKMNDKSKSIHDFLPLDLIHIILLRVPIRHLARLRCVSKLWCSLISDPDFAESHLHLSLAPTHGCLVRLDDSTEAYLVHLEEVFNGDNYQLMKEVSFPFKKKPPSEFCVMGSCRGFVLLSREPYFFVVWNPVTGFRKRISCMFHRSKLRCLKFPRDALLYGFGYDASRDDYLIVVASEDGGCQHLDCLSLRTNSWISLDAALPKPLGFMKRRPRGLFLNGSIHWLCYSHKKHYSESILTFDLKERSFSKISLPEQLRMHGRIPATIVTLGGYLALCYQDFVVERKTHIWVMKEYKVNSSWILYEIPCLEFEPLCLSNGSDIIALDPTTPVSEPLKFAKYNIREELLQYFTCPPHLGQERYFFPSCTVYTESLLLLPNDIE